MAAASFVRCARAAGGAMTQDYERPTAKTTRRLERSVEGLERADKIVTRAMQRIAMQFMKRLLVRNATATLTEGIVTLTQTQRRRQLCQPRQPLSVELSIAEIA